MYNRTNYQKCIQIFKDYPGIASNIEIDYACDNVTIIRIRIDLNEGYLYKGKNTFVAVSFADIRKVMRNLPKA